MYDLLMDTRYSKVSKTNRTSLTLFTSSFVPFPFQWSVYGWWYSLLEGKHVIGKNHCRTCFQWAKVRTSRSELFLLNNAFENLRDILKKCSLRSPFFDKVRLYCEKELIHLCFHVVISNTDFFCVAFIRDWK